MYILVCVQYFNFSDFIQDQQFDFAIGMNEVAILVGNDVDCAKLIVQMFGRGTLV
jgi:hypothetical protein